MLAQKFFYTSKKSQLPIAPGSQPPVCDLLVFTAGSLKEPWANYLSLAYHIASLWRACVDTTPGWEVHAQPLLESSPSQPLSALPAHLQESVLHLLPGSFAKRSNPPESQVNSSENFYFIIIKHTHTHTHTHTIEESTKDVNNLTIHPVYVLLQPTTKSHSFPLTPYSVEHWILVHTPSLFNFESLSLSFFICKMGREISASEDHED